MLNIHSRSHNNFNAPLDQTNLTGDPAVDSALAYVVGLKEGRLGGLDTNGNIQLADGLPGNAREPMGFIVRDAAGYFYENKPALASKIVALCTGSFIVETDQIDTTETFQPGDKLYAGTGAKVGLVTKTPAAGAKVIGRALTAASATQPNLWVLAASN